VSQLLTGGSAPYVDFSLFGPYGRRALKKVALTAFTYQVETGTWRRVEMPGPPDFDAWWKNWQPLKTALLGRDCRAP